MAVRVGKLSEEEGETWLAHMECSAVEGAEEDETRARGPMVWIKGR